MANYFNYFTEVEEHFIRRRGKSLLVSPLDWCLIELWKDSGIPLHIALRGIDRSFESAVKQRKKAPRTLYYCHPAVIDAFEEYRQAEVGKREEPEAPSDDVDAEQVTRVLRELEDRLQGRTGEVFERSRSRLRGLRSELGKGRVRPEEIDRTLNQIGALMAEWARDQLTPDELKSVRREVRSRLKIYKKRISPEMFQRLEQSYLERRLREEAGLPEFSLLSGADHA